MRIFIIIFIRMIRSRKVCVREHACVQNVDGKSCIEELTVKTNTKDGV
jgi:hypothetical protein